MRSYANTLLEHASQVAVHCQRDYAAHKGVPWGISESSSSKKDPRGNYHYFAFGVPQLAIFKPEQDGPVISPYSTCLALDVDPEAALKNLRSMERKGWLGPYGFYEALDFTPSKRDGKIRGAEVVRCWMAHHEGMSLLAIANFLDEKILQEWFHSHPRVQATELLLQEKPAARSNPQKAKVA
jgi:cyclic beta-1,2-glucan synthetase